MQTIRIDQDYSFPLLFLPVAVHYSDQLAIFVPMDFLHNWSNSTEKRQKQIVGFLSYLKNKREKTEQNKD